MNYLAHIYLSNEDPLVTIGNFIADKVKGKDYKTYNPSVQTGILLHRHIDTYTDSHKIVRQSTKRLHETYGHYSGVIVDIFYDHFLAKYWHKYSNTDLDIYVNNFYDLLQDHYDILPLGIKKIIPSLTTKNWLMNYESKAGISRVLKGMETRIARPSNIGNAIVELDLFYDDFKHEFFSFFVDLIHFSKTKLIELSK